MKIQIEIPDESYEWIKSHKGNTDFQTTQMLYKGVAEGEEVKEGEWLYFDGAMENYEPTYFYKCSVCRHRSDWYYKWCYKFERTSTPNYCPNCGAKMRVKK